MKELLVEKLKDKFLVSETAKSAIYRQIYGSLRLKPLITESKLVKVGSVAHLLTFKVVQDGAHLKLVVYSPRDEDDWALIVTPRDGVKDSVSLLESVLRLVSE